MLSKDELTAIRERCEAATAGPWEACECGCGQVCSIPGDCMVLDTSAHHFPAKREGFPFSMKPAEDAIFCAHAPTDIPRLLEHIAALERVVEAAKGLDHFMDTHAAPWFSSLDMVMRQKMFKDALAAVKGGEARGEAA